MSGKIPNVIFGYHGCSRDVGEDILLGLSPHVKPSTNEYDWLGHGAYFWENAPERAMEWARGHIKKGATGKAAEPFVLGAIIDLGKCLNLADVNNFGILRDVYRALVKVCATYGSEFPKNKGKLHDRDCMVINVAQGILQDRGEAFDTIRGAFLEGSPIYDGSAILEETHVQICVCNMDCVRGYFLPPGIN